WLDLDQTESHWALTDPGRLRRIMSDLPHPDRQQPSLVFFVGKRCKAETLRALYTSNNVSRRAAHGVANVLLDHTSDMAPHPVLLADCTPDATPTSLVGSWSMCHEAHRVNLAQHDLLDQDMVAFVQVNLLFSFSHVVCVFADDLGGNRAAARYVENWTRLRLGTAGELEVRPHLLIVTTESRDMDALMQVECHSCFDSTFESLYIVVLDKTAVMSNREKVRRILNHVIEDARQLRQERHLLLSASALADVFSRAVEAIGQDATTRVDLLTLSQHPAHSLARSLVARHLQHFLSLAVGQCPASTIVQLLASALLVQGYIPTAHSKEEKFHDHEGMGADQDDRLCAVNRV
ncbi:hypothetical protein OHC33_011251, partial [Knufia fluminis]